MLIVLLVVNINKTYSAFCLLDNLHHRLFVYLMYGLEQHGRLHHNHEVCSSHQQRDDTIDLTIVYRRYSKHLNVLQIGYYFSYNNKYDVNTFHWTLSSFAGRYWINHSAQYNAINISSSLMLSKKRYGRERKNTFVSCVAASIFSHKSFKKTQ